MNKQTGQAVKSQFKALKINKENNKSLVANMRPIEKEI